MPADRPVRGRPYALLTLGAVAVLTGASTGLRSVSSTPTWTGEGNQANAHYGYSVATAGDVNGDGYSDVIVGARDYDAGEPNEGRALVYHGGPAGPSTSADWTGEANQLLAFFGQIVAPAGDVDGDGFADVIVGAPNYDSTFTGEGRAYVFLGSDSGLADVPAWTHDGGRQGATFGSGVGTAGDVNGDGYDDILVGSRGYTGADTSEGRAYLFLGGPTGPASSESWTAEGEQRDAALGWSVGTAGDVDGDGYADVIVGAFLRDGAHVDGGQARVYLGGATGLAAAPVWTAEGDTANASFGWSVGTAGDVNGDGYADVVVGARFHSETLFEEGRAYVFHGSASGPDTVARWTVDGGEAQASFGWSVGTAGDVNGDGYADVIVGAYRFDDLWLDAGRALVFTGSASGLSSTPLWTAGSGQAGAQFGWSVGGAGDVDGDGHSDVIVGANFWDGGQSNEGSASVFLGSAGLPDTLPVWRGTGGGSAASYGAQVAWAGDVNGDGYSDALVADPLFTGPEVGEGRVDLFLGGAAGFDLSPDWSAEGDQTGASYGRSVARAGDVNGDGYDDFLVGAPFDDTAFPNAGRATVILGSAAGPQALSPWEVLGAGSSFYLGQSVTGAGDVNGDGYADVAVGAYQYDGAVADAGAVLIYSGGPGGPALVPDRILEGGGTFAQFGWSVALAGDVNGDGYSDLIVGEPGATDGESGEGKAHLYEGSPAGIGALPAWSAQGDQVDARFGSRVASAGDVNGDGYSDVVVCARLFDGPEVDEGSAFVYLGGPAGLSATAAWAVESDQAGAELAVARGAGDVNGDGYGDLVTGAPFYTDTQSLEGRTRLFLGSGGGPVAPAARTRAGGVALAQWGASVAGAGDAGGDGWGDLLVGSPGFADSLTSGGAAFLHSGNGAFGPAHAVRQLRQDGTAPVALLGSSESETGFALDALARTAAGRARVAMEWEAKPLGVAFDGATTVGGLLDTGAPQVGTGSAVLSTAIVGGLAAATAYRWRVRFRTTSPWFATSRWLHHTGKSPSEADLRTRNTPVAAPPPVAQTEGIPALSVRPSPFRRRTEIAFRNARAGLVRVAVYDVRGRLVRSLQEGVLPSGPVVIAWDGRDTHGNLSAPGLYFVRLRTGAGSAVRRAVLLR